MRIQSITAENLATTFPVSSGVNAPTLVSQKIVVIHTQPQQTQAGQP